MDLRPNWIIDPTTPIPDPLGLGKAAIECIESLILPDGELFALVPEQKQIVRKIFGDVDETGRRKTDVCYLHLPSGNAKSTLAAACAYVMLAHPDFRIRNGQLVIAAATREQAKSTSFGMIEGFIRRRFPDDTELAQRFRIVSNAVTQEITHVASWSTLKVLSRSPSAQEGLSVYFLLAEETHVWAQQADRLWDVLRKSQAKVKAGAPLAMIATTAGVGVGGIGHRLYEISKDIASGKVVNPGWLPVLYEMMKKDDWRDENVWRRLNFGIPNFKSLQVMRSLAREAETSLQARAEFLRYHLNLWAEGIGDPWIDTAAYDKGGKPFSLKRVSKFPCYLGVDAGETSDLTAVVALFHDEDRDLFYVVPHIWVPAASIKRRSEEDSVPYLNWKEAGYLKGTKGSSIDENVIEKKIRDLCDKYEVRGIGFDPWNTRRMMSRLKEDGLKVVEIPQQYALMSPAMKNTAKAILDGRLRHGAHPVLRWCFLNVPLPRPDPNGNIKPNKRNVNRAAKIDAAVATMIAMCLATVADEDRPWTSTDFTGRTYPADGR